MVRTTVSDGVWSWSEIKQWSLCDSRSERTWRRHVMKLVGVNFVILDMLSDMRFCFGSLILKMIEDSKLLMLLEANWDRRRRRENKRKRMRGRKRFAEDERKEKNILFSFSEDERALIPCGELIVLLIIWWRYLYTKNKREDIWT